MNISTQNSSELSPDVQAEIKKLLLGMQTARSAFEKRIYEGLLELHQTIEHGKNKWRETKRDILADNDKDAEMFQSQAAKLFEKRT